MEKHITIKKEYDSLDTILAFLKKESTFDCSKQYDIWDIRKDANGLMEECIVIKKSNMHGMKAFLTAEKELKLSYIIPNKMMNAYFGKSQKARKGILDLIAGQVKNMLLAGSQKKAFEELAQTFTKIRE